MELPYTDKMCEFFSLTKLVTEDTIDDHDVCHLDPRIKEWFDSIKVVAKLRESDLTAKSYITPELNMTDLRREITDFIMQEPYDGDRRLRAFQSLSDLSRCVSCPNIVPQGDIKLEFYNIGTRSFPYWYFPEYNDLKKNGCEFSKYQVFLYSCGSLLRLVLYTYLLAFDDCGLKDFSYYDTRHEDYNIGLSVSKKYKKELDKKSDFSQMQLFMDGNDIPTTDQPTVDKSFRSLINPTICSDPDGLLAKLHQLIDGKRGKEVSAIISKLWYDKLISIYPSKKAVEDEFAIVGSYEGIRKYYVTEPKFFESTAKGGSVPAQALAYDFSEFIAKK